MNYWLLSLTFIAVNLDFFLSANLTSIFRKRRGPWLASIHDLIENSAAVVYKVTVALFSIKYTGDVRRAFQKE